MSTAWKKYGGTNNFENANNITVHNLVAHHLTLKEPYYGSFTICGDVIVQNQSFFYDRANFYGNVYAYQQVDVSNLYVQHNVDISNNLTVQGNTYLYNPLYLKGSDGQGTSYLFGKGSSIGINTTNPIATLDINSTAINALHLSSTQSLNRNVLAKNVNGAGIVLSVDTSYSYIDFFQSDNSINDINLNQIQKGGARMKYDQTGILTLDVSSSIELLSHTQITARNDIFPAFLNNETAIIYDSSNGVYLYDAYRNGDIYTGNALSLISSDLSASTFLKIATMNNKGMQWGGGAFPNDTTRNMGTMGYTDQSNNYVPIETVVSGKNPMLLRGTVGFNTYSPKTENYVLDINGPVIIDHTEIYKPVSVNYELHSVTFSPINPLLGVAVGGTSKYYTTTSPASLTDYSVLTTKDGGVTWTSSLPLNDPTDLTLKTTITNFNSFIYDSSHIWIAAGKKENYYSYDGGNNWSYQTIDLLDDNSIPTVTIMNIGNNKLRLFLSYSSYSKCYDFSTNLQALPVAEAVNGMSNSSTINILGAHGSGKYYFTSGSGGIEVYDISLIRLPQGHTITGNYYYNSIFSINGTDVVAVGNNIISYTHNSGIGGWTDIYTDTTPRLGRLFLNSVYVYDKNNAIAVGISGEIVYSNDGYNTWQILDLSSVNSMGNGSNLITTINNLTSVNVLNQSTFIFSAITQDFSNNVQYGKSDIYHIHLPNIFNRTTYPPILDVKGNMTVLGDIHINDGGKLNSDVDTFYILNDTVRNIYFGNDASYINIGNSVGVTKINHQLDVSDNTFLRQNLSVGGKETIFNTTQSLDISSGALQVYGGVAIKKNTNIGGKLVVQSDTALNGQLTVDGQAQFKGKIFNTNTSNNTWFGNTALLNIGTGQNNTAFGNQSILTNRSGHDNTAVGYKSLYTNSSGSQNIAIGSESLNKLAYSNDNIAIGCYAMQNTNNTNPNNAINSNTAIGNYALQNNIANNITAIGFESLKNNKKGANNTSLGYQTLYSNVDGSNNTALGYQTLYNLSGGNCNTGVGNQSLRYTTLGSFNTAVGNYSLKQNILGTDNTAIGHNSLTNDISGSYNTAVGSNSLTNNTFGINNTAIGHQALLSNTIGNNNVAFGKGSLENNISGQNNTGIGTQSLSSDISGSNNTAIGAQSMQKNTYGSNNTGIGYQTLSENTIGNNNVGLGNQALSQNTTGNSNIGLGNQSLRNNTTGSNNISLGNSALATNQIGLQNLAIGNYALENVDGGQIQNVSGGNYNTAIGFQALRECERGFNNTAIGNNALLVNQGFNNSAIGYQPLLQNINGYDNTAIGSYALTSDVSGSYNTAIGYNALYSHIQGDQNTAVGGQALNTNITGIENTSVGYSSLYNNNGSNNTALGFQSGFYDYSGSYNTYIGYNAGPVNGNISYQNSTAIGYNAQITNSNQIMIGTVTNTTTIPGDLVIVGNTYNNNPVQNNSLTLVLNSNPSPDISYSSNGAGIIINENSPSTGGYIQTTNNSTGYKFKAPNSSNVVLLDTNTLVVPPRISNAVVMLKSINLGIPDISYSISSSDIDITNILIRDKDQSSATKQIITTDVNIRGSDYNSYQTNNPGLYGIGSNIKSEGIWQF